MSALDPEIKLVMAGNVFSRMMSFKKGQMEKAHSHQHDHATLVSSGSVVVRIKGHETVYTAPSMIWISKGLIHELEALEDGTVCACIHALRDNNSEIVDPEMIPDGALNDYNLLGNFQPVIHNP
jgi:quercetin dioxygenase-like cupin family protein